MPATFFSNAVAAYRHLPGDAPKIYRSLCYLLSQRSEQIEWHTFTPQDWQLFTAMAQNEGVAPLTHWQFRDGSYPSNMPAEVREKLANAYYKTLAYNTLLYEELNRILSAFEIAGIPVILLKGAALAQTVYPDVGLRPMGDLDFLVHQRDLPQVERTLERMGYTDQSVELWRGFSRLFAYEKNFIRIVQGQSILVEPHWNLIGGEASRVRPDIAWFWQHSTGQYLQPEDHLLYLAAHAFIKPHSYVESRLLWLMDIVFLLRQNEIDWQTVMLQAQKFNWTPALPALLQALSAVCDDTFARNTALLKNAASLNGLVTLPGMSFAMRRQKRSVFELLTLWGRVLLFIGVLFPSPAYMRTRYNFQSAWLLPLYYIKRLVSSARRVCGSVLTQVATLSCS